MATYTCNVPSATKRMRVSFQGMAIAALCFFLLVPPIAVAKQDTQKPAAEAPLPAQLSLLETMVRFETNGDSRKEVHAIVKINNEIGVRQFGRLSFDFNRAFQQIEIPFVRIAHASGGTADILPSAITDELNPAVVNASAYQDLRVKAVRILGLAPSDTLEYRVITTTINHPLAPDFWLDHSFDRTGVVNHELFELDLPGAPYFTAGVPGCNPEWKFAWNASSQLTVCGSVPYTSSSDDCDRRPTSRCVFTWDLRMTSATAPAESSAPTSDIIVSTYKTGFSLLERLVPAFSVKPEDQGELRLALQAAARGSASSDATLQDAYEFVSQKIATVNLPVGATGFRLRSAKDILNSGYATAEEKCMLLAGFARNLRRVSRSAPVDRKSTIDVEIVFPTSAEAREEPPRPSELQQPLLVVSDGKKRFALDPSLEVAPFAFIPAHLRGTYAFSLTPVDTGDTGLTAHWIELPKALPFPAVQRVKITASVTTDGSLSARVSYVMRGDNELVLRVAFHQAPKEKWNDVAQVLALSDGFRGKVNKTIASDPYETHNPFTLEYEITQPKFIDWSKNPVRVPAPLPVLGLPDPPKKSGPGAAAPPIELGTPLDVELSVALRLPEGTNASVPAGTSVERDFATYTSQYSAKDSTITASRRINFILREIRANRAADYSTFLRTVQNDEAQTFTLERADTVPTTSQKP